MDFKRMTRWGMWGATASGVIGASATLSACLSFQPLELTSGSFMNAPATDVTCLDQSAGTIESYWNGTLADSSSVGGLWDCTAKAVNVFESRVRGANPGVYTANEVRTLVTKFFLRNAVITDRLLEQAMKLKAAFLGGPTDSVTAGEIRQIQSWIGLFREQSARVYPFVGHFVGRTRLDDSSVERASAAVAELLESIGAELAHAGIALEFETLRATLDELSRFVDSPGLQADIGHLRDRVIILEMIKSDLVGGTDGQISGREWQLIFKRLAQTARWYLKLKQLDQNPV